MSQRIAVIAALPREVASLVRGISPDRVLLRQGISLYALPTAVIAVAGMGAQRVALAVEAALQVAQPELLISTGLAGACETSLAPGDVSEAAIVVEARTGERFRSASPQTSGPVLATAEMIANTQEKRRLHAAYGAALVDMEAATVARLAAAHGLPFRAIKGISDAHDAELGELSRFADARGQFRTAAFAFHTALRPARWRATARLGRDSARALTALQARLREIVSS